MVFLAILGVVIGLTASNVEKTNDLEKQLKGQRAIASEIKKEEKTEQKKD